MGYKDIVAGNKKARPVGARFIQSEKGTTGLEVLFKFEENGVDETLSWVGWLSNAAIDHTMKTLVEVLEFNGNDEVYNASEVATNPNYAGVIKDKKALAYDKDVELVVELEEYDGKTRPKIKWVNKPGSGSAFKGLTPEVVKSELGAIGFKAAFLAAKQSLAEPQSDSSDDFGEQSTFTEDDIPF